MESEHKPSLSHDWPMVSYMVPLFHGKVPVAKVYGPTPESSEDRAKLFASAPDMLAALENVRAIIAEAAQTGFQWNVGDWAERLFLSQRETSAAIAKAKGE